MTNQEIFNEKMSALAEALNKKNNTSGSKTLDELVEVSDELKGSKLWAMYIVESNGDDYIVNPYTYEPYIGFREYGPSQEEIESALAQICIDYHLTTTEYKGEIVYLAPKDTVFFTIKLQDTGLSEFPVVKMGRLGDLFNGAYIDRYDNAIQFDGFYLAKWTPAL